VLSSAEPCIPTLCSSHHDIPTATTPARVRLIARQIPKKSLARVQHPPSVSSLTNHLMAGFVGSAVIVTLKQGAVIQGFVQAVDPTSASLVLQDGKSSQAHTRPDICSGPLAQETCHATPETMLTGLSQLSCRTRDSDWVHSRRRALISLICRLSRRHRCRKHRRRSDRRWRRRSHLRMLMYTYRHNNLHLSLQPTSSTIQRSLAMHEDQMSSRPNNLKQLSSDLHKSRPSYRTAQSPAGPQVLLRNRHLLPEMLGSKSSRSQVLHGHQRYRCLSQIWP
jgi:small nuclear ribonucleoprotein (snRNP)-like protein